MTRKDLALMSDIQLHEWCIEHDLVGCADGDCGNRFCIWCGNAVDEVIESINAKEERESDENHQAA